ncbi:MAG: hypothetical protein AABY07_02150 [Nanoarchaeota archaeon]
MKRGILVILLISVVLISGCKDFGFGKKTGTQPQHQTFVGGTKGVEIAFAQEEPPNIILDNGQETFFITLLIRNVGEFNILSGKLIASLSGIPQSSFGIRSMNIVNSFELIGVSKDREFVTPGGEDLLEFGEASYKPDVPGTISFPLRTDICYTYQNKAVSSICLKKNVLKKSFADVCEMNNNNVAVENSGGPIHITNVRQNSAGNNRIKISFKVVDKDVGTVFEPGTFSNACVGHEDDKDRVKVTITNPQNNFNIECTQFGGGNSGTVKLINNEKDVNCLINTASLQEVSYKDILLFTADYQYRQAVTTTLVVENAG